MAEVYTEKENEVIIMRKIPVGIQTFKKIRTEDYLYVDKTEYIWQLVSEGTTYFLSRPRRFGKSLFVSTLESYFSGRRDLFRGLWIEEKENGKGENAWTEYPVISFYLSSGFYDAEDGLKNVLHQTLAITAKKYGISLVGKDLVAEFKNLIIELYEMTEHPVVVLVDEYDKPLLTMMLTDQEQEERNRTVYKGFFSVLKDLDMYLKFVFFTGVTKFTKVSIFSDLNQLKDISLLDAYSGICGISEAELKSVFEPEIKETAERHGITREECLAELARMYDGYHFSGEGEGVYNPFSLLNALQDRKFGSYWFGSGTPDILIRKLEQSSFSLEEITDGVEASEQQLQDYRAEDTDPIPLFYQTGYLTIGGYDQEFQIYSLRFPNAEVKYGFMNSLSKDILGRQEKKSALTLRNMILDLRRGDLKSFMDCLISVFASLPYPEGKALSYEETWKYQIFLILELLGMYVVSEVHTGRGRADCVIETEGYIYIFEFKIDQTADEALKQIDEKGCAEKYTADQRRLFKVGVSFSAEKRNIDSWKMA